MLIKMTRMVTTKGILMDDHDDDNDDADDDADNDDDGNDDEHKEGGIDMDMTTNGP